MQENMIEHNIIITEPCKNLRTLGRNALHNKWKTSIIAVCIFILVIQFPPIVFNAIFGTNIGSLVTNNGYTYGIDAGAYAQILNDTPNYCALSGIYLFLIVGAMTLGISLFFLATFRRHDVKVTDIFLGFERFGKALGLYLFMYIFIFLWSCLFIIPGIIASIRYSQAFFVLADDPSKGIRQCMNESKAMMKGNKATYFVLSLTFIGWLLLSVIPATIIESIGTVVSGNEFIISLFSILGQLCTAPVLVYIYSTFAGFYEILAGHLIKETKPIPVTVAEAQETYADVIESPENVEAKKASEEASEENKAEQVTEEPVAKATEEPADTTTEVPADKPEEESKADDQQ